MAKHFLTLFLMAAVAAILLAAAAATAASPNINLANSTDTPTAYEMLERDDFPPGILPEGAEGYELRPDGFFEVHLPADCNFRIAKRYKLHYRSRVAGSIRNGSITGLEGVKVKVLLAWIGIRQVGRDGDQLTLHVGSMSKSFPVDKFAVSPHCN